MTAASFGLHASLTLSDETLADCVAAACGLGLGFHLQPTTDDAAGPHNFGWRGIGGTIFIVDEENDFYLVYMVQKWGGPTDTPFTNDIATRMVYEAMRN